MEAQNLLHSLEEVIQKSNGLIDQTSGLFLETGRALRMIKQQKLFQLAGYSSLRAYVDANRNLFKCSGRHADRLIAVAGYVDQHNLSKDSLTLRKIMSKMEPTRYSRLRASAELEGGGQEEGEEASPEPSQSPQPQPSALNAHAGSGLPTATSVGTAHGAPLPAAQLSSEPTALLTGPSSLPLIAGASSGAASAAHQAPQATIYTAVNAPTTGGNQPATKEDSLFSGLATLSAAASFLPTPMQAAEQLLALKASLQQKAGDGDNAAAQLLQSMAKPSRGGRGAGSGSGAGAGPSSSAKPRRPSGGNSRVTARASKGEGLDAATAGDGAAVAGPSGSVEPSPVVGRSQRGVSTSRTAASGRAAAPSTATLSGSGLYCDAEGERWVLVEGTELPPVPTVPAAAKRPRTGSSSSSNCSQKALAEELERVKGELLEAQKRIRLMEEQQQQQVAIAVGGES